jgi:hypothetical protein
MNKPRYRIIWNWESTKEYPQNFVYYNLPGRYYIVQIFKY